MILGNWRTRNDTHTRYLAKIQGTDQKITIAAETLKQAKACASREFRDFGGFTIVLIQYRDGIGFNDIVATKKIGSKNWISHTKQEAIEDMGAIRRGEA